MLLPIVLHPSKDQNHEENTGGSPVWPVSSCNEVEIKKKKINNFHRIYFFLNNPTELIVIKICPVLNLFF